MEPLSPLEEEYREKLLVLFARVQPQKPEKGVQALLARVRKRVREEDIPEARALEEMYRGAVERTERRVRLLESCRLKPN